MAGGIENKALLLNSTNVIQLYSRNLENVGGCRGCTPLPPPPEMRPFSSCLLFKFDYLASQLRHSLELHPRPPKKNPGSAPASPVLNS